MSNDDMTRGYLDGFSPDAIEPGPNHSASYRHGWLNGRDDRLHEPRSLASELRQAAKDAEALDRLAGIDPAYRVKE